MAWVSTELPTTERALNRGTYTTPNQFYFVVPRRSFYSGPAALLKSRANAPYLAKNRRGWGGGSHLPSFQPPKEHFIGVATTLDQFYFVVLGKSFNSDSAPLLKSRANTPKLPENRIGCLFRPFSPWGAVMGLLHPESYFLVSYVNTLRGERLSKSWYRL